VVLSFAGPWGALVPLIAGAGWFSLIWFLL